MGKTANSPNLSGIKLWIALPSKEPQVTEGVAGRKWEYQMSRGSRRF